MTNANNGGWRSLYWMQAAFHGATTIGLLLFYHPQRRSDYPKMTFMEYVWACDPIGSGLFISSATLMLLALNWAGGTYAWSDAHVVAPLVVGIVLCICFGLYGMASRGFCRQFNILTSRQNGKAEAMASSLTYSSPAAPTLPSPLLLSQSKAGYSTRPSTPSPLN